ncbi:MAG: radical SAM protein [Planctomycetota bacterium]|jgi:23S rRNA (adenine2503-C2)-methyltransferase
MADLHVIPRAAAAPPSNRDIDALGLGHDAAVAAAVAAGHAADRASEAWRAVHRTGRSPVPWMVARTGPVVRTLEDGATRKFLLDLGDGMETESVLIPSAGQGGAPRTTLCVSSQVGCAMGCDFCETAQMGLRRNLETRHVLWQWHAARFALAQDVRNIVFMGMGEPMDNLDAVLAAIEILTDRRGPDVAPSRITVSTVGRTAGIRRLDAFTRRPGMGPIRLAVSVNAADDETRSRLMPINRAEPLAALREAMVEWCAGRRRRVLIEYVVIPGENESRSHARALAAYLGDLPCMVNVIPYNPRRDSPWPAPDEAAVDAFVGEVAAAGLSVRRRRTRGRASMAACGQLGNEAIRRDRGSRR